MTELSIAEFNRADSGHLRPLLDDCLAVRRWTETVLNGRPYDSREHLLDAAGTAVDSLSPDEVRAAIAHHPRIGERPTGSGTAAEWSRREQSGVRADLTERMREANARYEERFGHIYLVCATGRSGEDLLADLNQRLDNDPDTELGVVNRELRKIAVLRLGKVVREAP